MASYRSRAARWGKGDKVLSTNFETVEDNADKARQAVVGRTLIHPSAKRGAANSLVHRVTSSVAEVRVTSASGSIELSFGTCSTNDVLHLSAQFPVLTATQPCTFRIKVVSSGVASSTVINQGIAAGVFTVVSLSGTHKVTTAATGVRHYGAVYMQPTATAANTSVFGQVSVTGYKWRAVP